MSWKIMQVQIEIEYNILIVLENIQSYFFENSIFNYNFNYIYNSILFMK